MTCTRRWRLDWLAIGVSCCIVSAPYAQQATPDSRARAGRLSQALESEQHPPFKIFDNLYYVGINFVSAYLLPTSDGLILVDTTYDENVNHVLDGVRAMGFDPLDIKYIFATHWHADHFGGAPRIQSITGATVGMLGPDWDEIADSGGVPEDSVLRIKDEDTITLGDTTLTFYHIPGHTLGTMGIAFDVRDGEKTHRAFTFGGAGLNFSGVERTEMYIASVKRVLAMEGLEVNIPNHAMMAGVFEKAEELAARKPGEPHPFVAPDELRTFLEELLHNGEDKLVSERAQSERQ